MSERRRGPGTANAKRRAKSFKCVLNDISEPPPSKPPPRKASVAASLTPKMKPPPVLQGPASAAPPARRTLRIPITDAGWIVDATTGLPDASIGFNPARFDSVARGSCDIVGARQISVSHDRQPRLPPREFACNDVTLQHNDGLTSLSAFEMGDPTCQGAVLALGSFEIGCASWLLQDWCPPLPHEPEAESTETMWNRDRAPTPLRRSTFFATL